MARKSAKGEVDGDVRRKHVEQWGRTDLDKDTFCERNGITPNQLSYWLRSTPPAGAPARPKKAFARVMVAKVPLPPSKPGAARLVIGGGACLEIDGSVDPLWAARVIAAIGGRP